MFSTGGGGAGDRLVGAYAPGRDDGHEHAALAGARSDGAARLPDRVGGSERALLHRRRAGRDARCEPSPTPMRPAVSDFDLDGSASQVDWLQTRPVRRRARSSRARSTPATRVPCWGTLTPTGDAGIDFETRTGNTRRPTRPGPRSRTLGAGGAIQSPPGRYIQYQATLDRRRADRLAGARAGHDRLRRSTTSGRAPRSTAIDVSGTTASVRFSSPDADVAGFECSLDGGALATCTSPASLRRARSRRAQRRGASRSTALGNVGSAGVTGFTVGRAAPAPPPASPAAIAAGPPARTWPGPAAVDAQRPSDVPAGSRLKVRCACGRRGRCRWASA